MACSGSQALASAEGDNEGPLHLVGSSWRWSLWGGRRQLPTEGGGRRAGPFPGHFCFLCICLHPGGEGGGQGDVQRRIGSHAARPGPHAHWLTRTLTPAGASLCGVPVSSLHRQSLEGETVSHALCFHCLAHSRCFISMAGNSSENGPAVEVRFGRQSSSCGQQGASRLRGTSVLPGSPVRAAAYSPGSSSLLCAHSGH